MMQCMFKKLRAIFKVGGLGCYFLWCVYYDSLGQRLLHSEHLPKGQCSQKEIKKTYWDLYMQSKYSKTILRSFFALSILSVSKNIKIIKVLFPITVSTPFPPNLQIYIQIMKIIFILVSKALYQYSTIVFTKHVFTIHSHVCDVWKSNQTCSLVIKSSKKVPCDL